MSTFMKVCRPLLASLGLALVTTAWAGDDAPTAKSPPERERPLLSGPEVGADAAAPMRRGRNGEMMAPGRRDAEIVPARLWIQTLRSLDLDDEQKEAVQTRLDAHRDAMIEFNEEHGEAMREIRLKMRELRLRMRDQPDGDPEAAAELRKQMQAIEAKMPRIETVQRDLWNLLREGQQEALKARIAEIREEIIKRREAELERARSGEQAQERRRAAPDDAQPPARRRPGADEGTRPRPRRDGAPPRPE